MNTNENVVKGLNHLLTRSYDAQKGYQEAGEQVTDTHLREWLYNYSTQRTKFIQQLESEIRRLGGEPNQGSSVLGGLHRAWLDIKANFSTATTESVLEECIRGEEKALSDYSAVLTDYDLSAATREVVSQQHELIRMAIDQLHNMEDVVHTIDLEDDSNEIRHSKF